MSFLSPFFLWGLLAVSIPVILHFINLRRPKKVAFSTLAFFKRLEQSTIKRIKLKRWLLLALRCIAVFCLAVALARPFLPPVFSLGYDAADTKKVGLLIDNSASMTAINEKGPLIDQAKSAATEIINLASPNDKFYIQTTNGEGHTAAPVSPNRALELIDEIKAVRKGSYLRQRIFDLSSKMSTNSSSAGSGIIQVISDAQSSELELLADNTENETLEKNEGQSQPLVQLIKIGESNERNIAVSNLELKSQLLSKDNPVIIQAEVSNYSTAAASNQFISMEADGRIVGQYQADLEPGEAQSFLFEFTPSATGSYKGKIIIEGDDVTFDNEYFFSVQIPRKRSLLLVTRESENGSANGRAFGSYLEPALAAAAESNQQLDFTTLSINELNKADWQNRNAVIFDGIPTIPEYYFKDLQSYVQNGNGLMFIPSEKGDIDNYNSFFSLFNGGKINGVQGSYGSFQSITSIEQLIEGHPILDDMFDKQQNEEIKLEMPDIYYHYQYQPSANSGGISILETKSGEELLVERSFGEGTVLLSLIGTDPGWSNFPVNPLFAPVYFRGSLYASASDLGGFKNYNLGHPLEIFVNMDANRVEIVKDSSVIIPDVLTSPTSTSTSTSTSANGQLIRYAALEWVPGWASIKSDKNIIHIALNLPTMESDLSTLDNSALQSWVGRTNVVNSIVDVTKLQNETKLQRLNEAGFGKEIWYWFVLTAVLILIAETVISKKLKAEKIS